MNIEEAMPLSRRLGKGIQDYPIIRACLEGTECEPAVSIATPIDCQVQTNSVAGTNDQTLTAVLPYGSQEDGVLRSTGRRLRRLGRWSLRPGRSGDATPFQESQPNQQSDQDHGDNHGNYRQPVVRTVEA